MKSKCNCRIASVRLYVGRALHYCLTPTAPRHGCHSCEANLSLDHQLLSRATTLFSLDVFHNEAIRAGETEGRRWRRRTWLLTG